MRTGDNSGKAMGGTRRTRDGLGFTLAELLVVIAIMAILLALAKPLLTSFASGTGMNAGITQLKSTLSLARQWAITRRQTTYVVFPGLDDGVGDHRLKACRSYAVFAVTNRTTGAGRYISEWVYLPAGIVFDNDVALGQNIFKPAYVNAIPFPAGTSTVVNVHALGYRPDGTLGAGQGCEVYFREGWLLVPTNNPTGRPDYGKKPTPMNRSVEVYSKTGLPRVKDYSQ